MRKLIDIFRILFDIHSIKDDSTCKLSQKYWNVHDYNLSKGGDGQPSHFHEYNCSKCGEKFEI